MNLLQDQNPPTQVFYLLYTKKQKTKTLKLYVIIFYIKVSIPAHGSFGVLFLVTVCSLTIQNAETWGSIFLKKAACFLLVSRSIAGD